ncbi:MAG: DUF2510 domain-containing protein [Jatrophihabitantaceae bacterium]
MSMVTPAQRPSGRRLKLGGFGLMVLGVLAIVAAGVPIVHAFSSTVVDELSSPVYTAPFDTPVTLKRGKYLLMESQDGSAQLHPAELRVVDSTGTVLTDVRQSSGSYSMTRNGERFVGEVEFTASQTGRYQIYVAFPPNARLMLARDPVDAFARVGPWFALGGGGALLGLLGFVLLLLGFGQNRSQRRPPVLVYYGQQTPASSAPGWYPDPHRPGGWRYWDGYRWQP